MAGAAVEDELWRSAPRWLESTWVSMMWVTPLIAAALSDTKAGLPVKNGSISTALPAKSSRKPEWPYQVICMIAVLGWGGVGSVGRKIPRRVLRSTLVRGSSRFPRLGPGGGQNASQDPDPGW